MRKVLNNSDLKNACESKTPLISIITATYNAESCLENLLKSIKLQKTDNIEFVIIDGASKDNTISIIKRYNEFIDYWISEPDTGIYDAWNKGVKLTTGEWIMFLGADDQLMPKALKTNIDFILKNSSQELDLISSKIEMIDNNRKSIRIKGWKWEWPRFLYEMTIAHPGALHSRKLFVKHGLFNQDYKIAGDYELLLRPRNNLKTAFIDAITVKMCEGGTSDSIAAAFELYKLTTKTGGANRLTATINATVIILKYLIKSGFRHFGFNVYLRK